MPAAHPTTWPLLLLVSCWYCCVGLTLAVSSFPLAPVQSSPLLLPVALPPVARRQTEVVALSPPLQPGEREPSCSELRAMWRHLRRMGRQMEFTNEIPKMQDPFTASAMDRAARPGAGRRRLSKYPDPNPYTAAAEKSSAKDHAVFHKLTSAGRFDEVMRNHQSDRGPNGVLGGARDSPGFHEFDDYPGSASLVGAGPRHVPGRFADTALPEETLGVYGTVVHTPEERARIRAKNRRPGDYGMNRYRNRWHDSTGLGRVPFRAPQPHPQYHYGSVVTHGKDRHPLGGYAEFPQEVGQRSPGGGVRVERIDKIALASKLKNSCLRVQNRTCKTDVDCYCIGSPKLFCGGSRCRPLRKAFKYGKQKWVNNWLSDPYESNLLGFSLKRDPVWPEPF